MERTALALKKIYSKLPVLSFDLFSILIAWYLSYVVRYNMQPFPSLVFSFSSLSSLSILFFVQVGFFYYF